MEFGMSCRIKPKRNMCAFQLRKFGAIYMVHRKIKNYVVKFELIGLLRSAYSTR